MILGVTLNVPAGLWGKVRLTSDEVLESRKIATARVHVERVIGYVKNYKIVSNRVNRSILKHISEIFFVCCALMRVFYMWWSVEIYNNNSIPHSWFFRPRVP